MAIDISRIFSEETSFFRVNLVFAHGNKTATTFMKFDGMNEENMINFPVF